MTTDVKQLLDRALELSEEERATLAGWLIESLEGETPEGVEAAWRREIELRVNELEAGEVNTVPWNVVKDRLAQRGG
jgi:putative addiction module component (TIGR02574 family)